MFDKKKVGDQMDSILNEIHSLSSLDHPYIVRYFETYDTKKYLYLVMEYLDGYLLKDLIEKNTKDRSYGERTVANIILKLLKALAHCHTHKIIHRDINPTNIMITENEDSISLIDFGLCSKESQKSTSKVESDPSYTAPEVFEGKTTTQSDMWSLGVVLYQMISGYLPFDQKSLALTIKDIMANDWHWRSPEFDHVSKECKDLIKRLLTKNPSKRLTAAKA